MLRVKQEKFSIQGTGEAHFYKQGDIVADEIFVKEFPKDSGVKILNGLLADGVLEGKLELSDELQAKLKASQNATEPPAVSQPMTAENTSPKSEKKGKKNEK